MKKSMAILMSYIFILGFLTGCVAGTQNEIKEISTEDSINSTYSDNKEIEESSINKEQLYGNYIDISTGRTMVITDEKIKFSSSDEGHGTEGTGWTLEGDVIHFGSKKFTVDNSDGISVKVVGQEGYDADYNKKEKVEATLGETFTADSIEYTISKVEYASKLDSSRYLPKEEGGGIVSSDGLIYACIYYKVKNIGKEPIKWKDYSRMSIDYNDGYIFSTVEENVYCYLTEINGTDKVHFVPNRISEGREMIISPLTENEFMLAIPVAEAVRDDKSSSVLLNIYTKDLSDVVIKIQ